MHVRQRVGTMRAVAMATLGGLFVAAGGCQLTRPASVADAYPTAADARSGMYLLEAENQVLLRASPGRAPLGPRATAHPVTDVEVLRRAQEPLWAR